MGWLYWTTEECPTCTHRHPTAESGSVLTCDCGCLSEGFHDPSPIRMHAVEHKLEWSAESGSPLTLTPRESAAILARIGPSK